jgi:septal ring factor EnvC (AmiA/AmiB activator)
MTTWVEALKAANETLKLYHTIEKSLGSLEDSFKLIRSEATSLRTEIIQLEGRVSKLEESRSTIAAEVRATLAEGVAEMKILTAQTVADLKVDYARQVSDLYRRDMERQLADAKNQSLLNEPQKP